ncbi:MAG: histidinol-phosphate transaminase [Candidatus Acidiferrales bacterium]
MKNRVKPRRALEKFHEGPPMLENRRAKLRLDMNESMAGCSPKVRAALRRLGSEEIAMYPEKENATARIAPYFGVSAREMALTGGIDEALRLVADVFIERGRSVVLVEPTFPMYRFHAEQRDARIHTLFCADDMRFPLDDVLRALKQAPAVFFLANPNNPTGALLDKRALAKILDAADRTLVVVDEAYFEFSGVTVLPWIRRRKNLVVTRTFSKAAGLAGLRIGCLFAHREIAKIVKRAQGPFPIGIAPLAAAEAALRDPAFTRRAAAEISRGRKLLEGGLCELGVRVFPSAANFLLADFGARGPKVIRALARRGILIRDQTASIGRPGFARITAGTPAQMRRFLRAVEQML